MPALRALIAWSLALALTTAVASRASAQALAPGRITGQVADSTGGTLPGTQVTLTADDLKRSVVTDLRGTFTFDGVLPETVYTIEAKLPGFDTATRQGVIVSPGATVTVDLSLKLSCLSRPIVLYGMFPPLDNLLAADAVVHLRIEESHEVQINTGGGCPRYYDHASATLLQVSTASRGEWRPGMAIELYSDHALIPDSEYVAFLTYDAISHRYKLGEPFIAMRVVRGRLESSWEGAFGFRDGAPVGRAVARIRETYVRHTRYRPHGAEGAEAPLERLRYKTGWFLIGGLGTRDEWIDLYAQPVGPTVRPFEFVGDPQSSRQLPRKGDRIQLAKGGIISILNFGSRGEAQRDLAPTLENTDASLVNVTGTRVATGGVYDVGDVVLESIAHDTRFVWVRLVAVKE